MYVNDKNDNSLKTERKNGKVDPTFQRVSTCTEHDVLTNTESSADNLHINTEPSTIEEVMNAIKLL